VALFWLSAFQINPRLKGADHFLQSPIMAHREFIPKNEGLLTEFFRHPDGRKTGEAGQQKKRLRRSTQLYTRPDRDTLVSQASGSRN
jgi:hypothetical protein